MCKQNVTTLIKRMKCSHAHKNKQLKKKQNHANYTSVYDDNHDKIQY